MKKQFLCLFICLVFIISGCTTVENVTAEPTQTSLPEATTVPTGLPVPSNILFSEILTGIKGNNNYEFIELYNPTDQPKDLAAHKIFYRLSEEKEKILFYEWQTSEIIPPFGHYLLVLEGQNLSIEADTYYEQPLVPNSGGLILFNPQGEILDKLGWGKPAAEFYETEAAPSMENGVSLERKPGGETGSTQDTQNNNLDFTRSENPEPQNSGSPITPLAEVLLISLETPETVNPGSTFEIKFSVNNPTNADAKNVLVMLSIPVELTISSLPDDMYNDGLYHYLELSNLSASETRERVIKVTAPWDYATYKMQNYWVKSDTFPLLSSGGPIRIEVANGSIPIQTAKQHYGKKIIVEGIATMYTDGLYAGTTGTKFYIEDETGGLQVYVSGGMNKIHVDLGARVQVEGTLELYRGAIELIPSSLEAIKIIEEPGDHSLWEPAPVSIDQAANDPSLAGLLVTCEGTISRVEEFSYSYEIDLTDSSGQMVTLYIDKLTEISIERIVSGQSYQITGIVEILDSTQQIYPRIQDDLLEISLPELSIQAHAPVNFIPGEMLDIIYTISNTTAEIMTDLKISAEIPQGVEALTISNEGTLQDDLITWNIAELPASGSLDFGFVAGIQEGFEYIEFAGYQVSSPDWPETVYGTPVLSFSGESVPIWAIQGQGIYSPYILEDLQTEGVVTGVFPELEGFWIQNIIADDNPLTSEGLFINTTNVAAEVEIGDYVQVSGTVREAYQQTQIIPNAGEELLVISQRNSLPNPISLDPPANNEESLLYYEAIEGMYVQVAEPALAVAPSNKYGEFAVVLPYHGKDRLMQGEENGFRIIVDDGISLTHEDQSTMLLTVNSGDMVSNIVGPLMYGFGLYMVEPNSLPEVTAGTAVPVEIQPASDTEFSVMTWNVENLFDFQDPHPSSPAMPTLPEYKLDLEKIVSTILAAGTPDVIGLQEVENIGILEDIAASEKLAEANYQPVLIEGTDSRLIDVGYLVKGDLEILETTQYPAPQGLTSRPPLLIKILIKGDEPENILYILNNHFTSMSGGEEATELRRNAQAEWNASLVEDLLGQEADAKVVVLGDLNSYYTSLPITTLQSAGLQHVFETLEPEERYTYIYEGVSQVLDHILVTPNLFEQINRTEILHINSDFPPPLPDDPSPSHKSDHDPVIVTFDK